MNRAAKARPATVPNAEPDGRTLLSPPWELGCLVVLAVALLILTGTGAFEFASIVGPTALTIPLSLSAILLVQADRTVLWTPVFWFRVTTAVYFGLGTLVVFIVNPYTLSQINAFFPVTPERMTKCTLVVTVGALVCLASVNFAVWIARRMRRPGAAASRELALRGDRRVSLLVGGVGFFMIGGIVKYLLALPYQFGLMNQIVPGAMLSIGLLTTVGLYLLTAWALEYRRASLIIVGVLLAIEMVVGLAAFSKANVLLPLVMVLLAWVQRRVNLSRFLVAAAIVVTCYNLITPIVEDGRLSLARRHGTAATGSLSERMEILFANQTDDYRRYSEFQGAYVRISYVNAASFAIFLHDSGRSINSFKNFYVIFVPRILWEDKPNLSNFGTEFNFLATRNDKSSSSPGIFAEAYWNGGWTELVAIMAAVGVVFYVWSMFTLRMFYRSDFFYFPVVFFGMMVGARVDGALVTDVFATAVFGFVLFVLLRTLRLALASPAATPARALVSRGSGGSTARP